MRALAVMLVVLSHAGLGHLIPGGSGVTLFFSISGFIITHLLIREYGKTGAFSISEFYRRRVRKLAPPLVLIVVIPTLVYSLWHSINWTAFAGQVFFFYNWQVIAGDSQPVLPGSGVTWSLSIEEQFYIAFAIVWITILRAGYRPLRVLAGVAMGAVISSTAIRLLLAMEVSSEISERIVFGSDTRIDGIAWGVLAAIALHRWVDGTGVPSRVQTLVQHDIALIVAVGMYLVSVLIRDDFFRDSLRFTFQSLAACIVILYGFGHRDTLVRKVFTSLCHLRAVQLIGLASYSIYLVHLSLTKAVESLVSDLDPGIAIPLAVLLSTTVGITVYRYVELPIQRRSQRAAMKHHRVLLSGEQA